MSSSIKWLPVALLLGLAGCTIHSERQTTVPTVVSNVKLVCLDLKEYSKADQQKAAQELAALPDGSILAQMIQDYGDMRDRDRVCLRNQ